MRYCLFLLIFLYSCKQKAKPPSDCARFKTGTFVLEDEKSPLRITRTEDIQTEKDLISGHTYKVRIKWKDDCNYTLTFVSSTDTVVDIDYKVVNVTIVKTEGDTYYYDSYVDGLPYVSNKLRKIK